MIKHHFPCATCGQLAATAAVDLSSIGIAKRAVLEMVAKGVGISIDFDAPMLGLDPIEISKAIGLECVLCAAGIESLDPSPLGSLSPATGAIGSSSSCSLSMGNADGSLSPSAVAIKPRCGSVPAGPSDRAGLSLDELTDEQLAAMPDDELDAKLDADRAERLGKAYDLGTLALDPSCICASPLCPVCTRPTTPEQLDALRRAGKPAPAKGRLA